MLAVHARAWGMVGKHAITELYPPAKEHAE